MQKNVVLSQSFLERLATFSSPSEQQTIIDALQTKPFPAFRTNTLKTTTAILTKQLIHQGFHLQPVLWYNDAFILMNKSVKELTATDQYKKGLFYIQSLSSMIPALVLNPKPTDKILDLCAAPGSKTTQLAMLMDNMGEIIANDLSRARLFKLKANLQSNGVTNTIVTNIVGEKIWRRYPEYFDKTLVDVPCSMEGRIALDDPKTYQDWSVKKSKLLANKQKYFLLSGISATKIGGTIVYSTCTLSPEENEGVIDWILKKVGDAVRLETIAIAKLPLKPGITEWTKPFLKELSRTARVLPGKTMEGFFVAKFKKEKSTLT